MLMVRRRRRVAMVCLLVYSRAVLEEGSAFAGVRHKVGFNPCKGMNTGCPHTVMDLAHIGIYKEEKNRGVHSFQL